MTMYIPYAAWIYSY